MYKVKVTNVSNHGITCELENGVKGIVTEQNMTGTLIKHPCLFSHIMVRFCGVSECYVSKLCEILNFK